MKARSIREPRPVSCGILGAASIAEPWRRSLSEIDSLFVKSQEPSLPPFLKERIVSTVSEAMRQDSGRGIFSHFFSFLASLRLAVVGAVLVLGIGLGVFTGWDLARSITRHVAGSSYDLVSLAGLGGEESGSSLEFMWTDNNGRDGR